MIASPCHSCCSHSCTEASLVHMFDVWQQWLERHEVQHIFLEVHTYSTKIEWTWCSAASSYLSTTILLPTVSASGTQPWPRSQKGLARMKA